MSKAVQVSVRMVHHEVEYIALQNSKSKAEIDTEIFTEAVNYLKLGQRIDAITYYQEHTALEYNEIIDVILYIENNLNNIIKEQKKCWFNDPIGDYEFKNTQELYHSQQSYSNYNTDKTEVTITCPPLRLKEIIASKDPSVIENRARNVMHKFNVKWLKEFKQYHAERENTILEEHREEINNILKSGLSFSLDIFDWDSKKDFSEFKSKLTPICNPNEFILKYIEPVEKSIISYDLTEPKIENCKFFSVLIGNIILKTKYKHIVEDYINKKYTKAHKKWEENRILKLQELEKEVKEVKEFNAKGEQKYKKELHAFETYVKELEKEEADFKNNQEMFNKKIDTDKEKYLNRDKESVEQILSDFLMNSPYPLLFKKEFSLEYNPENKILIIDYKLPNKDNISNLHSIEYSVRKEKFDKIYLRDKTFEEMYDNMLYQIILRTIYEIFQSDKNNFINIVVFNGCLDYIEKSTGEEKSAFIMSMQANKEEFLSVNFQNVDPKACFKSFKGIGNSALHEVTPIKPILSFNKNDKRFIEAYGVMNQVNEENNLASMDWQDFENLVREIFEKEFSQNGGEVKVTQSSRDGGVDAIAFDPDPIRGGKIVIQAKRYSNIVGVANVRDLYGTVMNEGAIKGILVTTSDYGSDSYEFVKDKPLTLLNGGHLLHLLEKHGHKARIDLKEAKELNKQQA